MANVFKDAAIRNLYCGFIDVLGFGEVTLADHNAAMAVYERILEKFEIVASGYNIDKVQLRFYSDAFIVLSEDVGWVVQASSLLSWLMIMEDFLVRGGIAYGPHVEAQRSGSALMVSSALTKAVMLEKRVRHPCIVLADDVEIPDAAWFDNKRVPAPIVHYFDGIRIVSPFSPMYFKSARHRAQRLLKQHPKHAEKYEWYLRLWNAVNERALLIPPDILEKYGFIRTATPDPIFPEPVTKRPED
jgi:hypothetical protein